MSRIPALVVLVVVAVGIGFRAVTARSSLQGEARRDLELWLQGRYAAQYLDRMDTANPTAADADSLLARTNVEVVSLDTRGRIPNVIVKSEIRVDGSAPPDGKAIRYWRMEYSSITGWMLRREVTALRWYLAAFSGA